MHNKLILECLIRDFLFSISTALVSFAIIFNFHILALTIILPIISFGIVFILYFILNKPTDITAAKRFDSEYHLKERTLTYIHFKDKSSLLINKQREDALQHLPSNKLSIKLSIVNIPILIVAAALFVGTFFVPNIADSISQLVADKPDPSVYNDYTSERVEEIKEEIIDIEADENLKAELYAILDETEERLFDITDEEVRQQICDEEEAKVWEILDKYNSKDEIGEALKNDAIKNASSEETKIWLEEIEDNMYDMSDEEALTYAKELSDYLYSALNTVEDVSANDDLRILLYKLADDLKQANDYNDIVSALDVVKDDLLDNMDLQRANEEVAEIVAKGIQSLVKPEDNSNSDDSNSQDGNGSDSSDSDGNSSGNGSSGDNGSGNSNGKGDSKDGDGTSGAGSGNAEIIYGSDFFTGDGYEDSKSYLEQNGGTGEALDDATNNADEQLINVIADYFDSLQPDSNNP